ncbi:antA/AntB antirepressor family protein [Eleftheria terrae]|uniref:antA/AntB antirepressor family protein n=1 Tax=Eleftheria terrae TaxID=1597781 RepID=UPI00263AD0C5|nr:antA/AntB antirepressor family protein [Eleftheria terrae]WKB50878.1 antA/AntB antirepressor family protein [Eleftheria terrae]
MNDKAVIPVLSGRIHGTSVPLVNARRLHEFLESSQDYTTWIKGRIRKYGFEEGADYLLHKFVEQVPHQGGWRTVHRSEVHLTLDMAKELAMVERTPRGRDARRYFIECERRLRQEQSSPVAPTALSRGQRQAINRRAWADVAGEAYAAFHARREELIREAAAQPVARPAYLPLSHRPKWAR